MVLGNVAEKPVCFYCNKPGHLRKDCYKLKSDLAKGQPSAGRGPARGGKVGGRSGGRGGKQLYNNNVTNDVIRLGLAAMAN